MLYIATKVTTSVCGITNSQVYYRLDMQLMKKQKNVLVCIRNVNHIQRICNHGGINIYLAKNHDPKNKDSDAMNFTRNFSLVSRFPVFCTFHT